MHHVVTPTRKGATMPSTGDLMKLLKQKQMFLNMAAVSEIASISVLMGWLFCNKCVKDCFF